MEKLNNLNVEIQQELEKLSSCNSQGAVVTPRRRVRREAGRRRAGDSRLTSAWSLPLLFRLVLCRILTWFPPHPPGYPVRCAKFSVQVKFCLLLDSPMPRTTVCLRARGGICTPHCCLLPTGHLQDQILCVCPSAPCPVLDLPPSAPPKPRSDPPWARYPRHNQCTPMVVYLWYSVFIL